jgi:hypothetical protein
MLQVVAVVPLFQTAQTHLWWLLAVVLVLLVVVKARLVKSHKQAQPVWVAAAMVV